MILPSSISSRLQILTSLFLFLTALMGSETALAGGPKYVAGATYFNPAVKGQAIHWAGGKVSYFVDNGPLGPLSNQQATEMVDTAAAIWNAVPTAAVLLTDQGNLAEDVNGGNVLAANGAFQQPADVTPSAIGTPVAVIFDSDGSVIEALNGTGASQPDNCTQNSVLVWIDAMNPDATMSHAVMVLNGRCATSASLLTMMSFQVERAIGRILGLDFSQVNDGAQNALTTEPNGIQGWPVMLPLNGECGPAGGACIPNPAALRLDDIAALNRIYPVTSANQPGFPGKVLTAANTASIQGTVAFRNGTGMQGVNVVARPLDANGNPMYQYTVTFVSGTYFCGNHGNPVTGWTDANGNRLDRFGSDDPAEQGYFDLSGIPLPPGMTSANFQVSFEAVNPLYINSVSVGPYVLGSPTPSGTLASVVVNGLAAGGAQLVMVTVNNSANGPISNVVKAIGVPVQRRVASGVVRVQAPRSITSPGGETQPRIMPASGAWTGQIAQVGQSDWFTFPVKGNRIFTVVTQALDDTDRPSVVKAMPALGVWDGFAATGTSPAGYAPAANGFATGETWLQVATQGDDIVRLAIADQRGDGRPDYRYRGWVLYADTVSPARLPAAGGSILIRGMGFRSGDTVKIGGVTATVTSLTPTEIWAAVPAAGAGVTGSLDVEVDDQPLFSASAVIPGGLSYDAGSNDALNLLTAPANQVPVNVPEPFTVVALGIDGTPAGGVTVTYTLTSGTAALGCGITACAVTTGGDGRATLNLTATNTSIAVVTASLNNGASVQAHFYGGTPTALTALTPTLYLAAGATANWPVQALAQNAQGVAAGQSVAWQTVSGIAAPAPETTNASGIATATLVAGPLAEGQMAASKACLNGTSQCATFNVFGARPEFAGLAAVSGTSQSVVVGIAAAPVVIRVLDMNGNPMAGGTVTVYQALYAWAPPCPPHGRCAQPALLATSSTTVTSALDGTVTVTPLTIAGQAANLTGIAAIGNAGSLTFTIETHS